MKKIKIIIDDEELEFDNIKNFDENLVMVWCEGNWYYFRKKEFNIR